MKEYKYTEKEIILNGHTHKAFYPIKHGIISALIFEVINKNANDEWANIPDYHTFCAIKKKGSKKWEILSDNLKTSEFYIGDTRPGTNGIYFVFFLLESKNIQDKILRNAEIQELKSRIKCDTKKLRALT